MLAAIKGEPTERIPWAPRLDLWYRASKRAGTLPDRYSQASLRQLVDETGMGYHAVVPDFQDLRSPEDDVDRALGIYNLWTMPYRTVLEGVKREVRTEGDRTFVRYETPAGPVTTGVLYDEEMRKAGITITHIEKYAIEGEQDYAPVGYIFENARVLSNYEGYSQFSEYVGDRGLAVGFFSLAASPVHLIQRELMSMERFFYELYDHPDEIRRLDLQIAGYWRRVLEVVSKCPAEVVLLGANYDSTVTYPPFFAEHIGPWLKNAADTLHRQGKFLLTHTDGENTGLLQHYIDSEIDIADSVCPAPMTKLSLEEVRSAFDERITIMGGIPSVALLDSSMSDNEFDGFLDRFFAGLGQGDHIILGISDTTPPAARFDRILEIGRRVEAFGPVRPQSRR
jgi:hypothetical protein